MKRGDIYMAMLDPVIGSEQGGRRPVVIIQNDIGNLHASTVIAVPLTGSTSKPPLPTHAPIPEGEGGLWRASTALCEQVRTLEKSRLSRRLGALSPESMQKVVRALQVSLDIPPHDVKEDQ
ncbi:MAG: type II toxin-antitoxin system PemK/MazF family toxin [Clostridia bacterium]|nr:type II toxin-antitoxin system PemK/MazF family toxin [Clostridia bacterium]